MRKLRKRKQRIMFDVVNPWVSWRRDNFWRAINRRLQEVGA